VPILDGMFIRIQKADSVSQKYCARHMHYASLLAVQRADKRSKSSGADIKRVELPQVATVPVEHVLLLKQAAEILYEQFIIYGDPRFQTVRTRSRRFTHAIQCLHA
jgi:hypothetical protein